MIKNATRFAAALCLALSTSSLASAAEPTGTWLTQQGDARIRVARCGANMCGTIVWLRDPIDPQTRRPQVDDKNPNPVLRNRRVIGLRIFAMAPDGTGGYAGSIYNADDGQSYRSKIILRSAEQLEVQGCAGPLCGSEQWRRVGR
ncbi:MAG: DUF2147 domain-containing protein [Xanthobacteraceae bacterium]|nr:DUF2147 domain-containing protein [Xanthobacteraceae bacterium]